MAGAFKPEYIVKNYHLVRKQDVRVINESSSTIAWEIKCLVNSVGHLESLGKASPNHDLDTIFDPRFREKPASLFAPLSITFY